MSEVLTFGLVVLVVAGGFSAAIGLSKVTERFPVPGPALFLLAAAIASDLFPGLSVLSIESAERIGVVALIVILFDGGMRVGWRRFRASAFEITLLGVLGTFGVAALMAVTAHYLLDFSWTTAGILGAALAPTDPAVLFSVLGKREMGGRSGTILEGESGANDPVGITLMIGMLEFATQDGTSVWTIVREFAVEMSVGLVIGVAGAAALLPLMRRIALPREALYPLRTLAFAGVIYGVASVAHGSGFLAVFVAGLLIGDARAPYKGEIERFHISLASLAEIAVFTVLGLTIDITDLGGSGAWLDGLVLALVLTFVARPLVIGPMLLPARLRWGERVFIVWGGLKGAVPILLGTLVLLEQVAQADRIYDIVFVVVAFSVLVQGTSVPFAPRHLGVPMHDAEPRSRRRLTVEPGSRAAGQPVGGLPIGERTWVQEVVREGVTITPRGSFVLLAGDTVELIVDVEDAGRVEHVFAARRGETPLPGSELARDS